MDNRARGRHRRLWVPLSAILGVVMLVFYGIVAVMSEDPLWFLGRTDLPNPRRIVIRVDGEETVLMASSPGYAAVVEATEKAMSSFESLAPRSAGLSEATLAEYQERGTILELYFDEPVDVHLPFDDGRPMALLIPIQGRHAGRGYVFRGKDGKWWVGQLVMSDPQPLLEALSALGYVQP
jgi:hypothetical protein